MTNELENLRIEIETLTQKILDRDLGVGGSEAIRCLFEALLKDRGEGITILRVIFGYIVTCINHNIGNVYIDPYVLKDMVISLVACIICKNEE